MLSTCAAPCARTPVLLGRGSKTSGGRSLRRANAARKSAAPKMGRDRPRICAVRADAALPESELEEGEIQGVRPRRAHTRGDTAPLPSRALPIVTRYCPRTDRWEELGDMPRVRWSLAAVARRGKVYVFGGTATPLDKAIVRKVDVYDPALEAWSTLPAECDLPLGTSARMM